MVLVGVARSDGFLLSTVGALAGSTRISGGRLNLRFNVPKVQILKMSTKKESIMKGQGGDPNRPVEAESLTATSEEIGMTSTSFSASGRGAGGGGEVSSDEGRWREEAAGDEAEGDKDREEDREEDTEEDTEDSRCPGGVANTVTVASLWGTDVLYAGEEREGSFFTSFFHPTSGVERNNIDYRE